MVMTKVVITTITATTAHPGMVAPYKTAPLISEVEFPDVALLIAVTVRGELGRGEGVRGDGKGRRRRDWQVSMWPIHTLLKAHL